MSDKNKIQDEKISIREEYSLISSISEIDIADWMYFIQHHPNGNIFNTPEMFNLFNSYEKYKPIFISAINSEKEICGLLIAFMHQEYKGLLGKLTSRAIVYGGPLARDNKPEIANLLLTEFDKICRKEAVYSQFRNLWDSSCFKSIFDKEGYKYEGHLNFLFDLSKGEEFLWNKIHPTRKKQINRSIKREVNTRIINELTQDELDSCYAILKLVYKAAKLPFPEIEFFQRAVQILCPHGYFKTIIATFHGEIIGFRFFLCYQGLLYDWYAGSLPEHHDKYPNDILPWELMRWGISNGYETFDFGGAGKPEFPYGVRDYKMKFGGVLVNFGRYEKVHKPFLMIIARVGFKVWRLL